MTDKYPGQLQRVLGPLFTIAVGLGAVIGGGILRTPATVLDAVPSIGLALTLWTVVGVQSLIEANAVAEVLTMFPRSGGYFVPARVAFGEPGGLLVGWSDWLSYVAAVASLALLVADFTAMVIPALETHRMAMTIAILLVLWAYNGLGVREGARAQIVGSAAKALFLLGIVALIFLLVPSQTSGPPRPSSPIGLAALIVAYQTIFGAYTGWNNAGYFAGEDKDPGRNIPRGMLITIISAMLLYLLVSVALSHSLPLDRLRHSQLPIADALAPAFGSLSVKIVAAGAALIVLTCCNANAMGAPRILHGLAEERMLPRLVRTVGRGGTPVVALALTMLSAMALALTGTFETVFLIMAALAMVPQILGEAALFQLRWTYPDLPRPWRARLYPLLPGLALITDVALLCVFIAADWKSGLYIVLAVAIVIPVGMALRRRR